MKFLPIALVALALVGCAESGPRHTRSHRKFSSLSLGTDNRVYTSHTDSNGMLVYYMLMSNNSSPYSYSRSSSISSTVSSGSWTRVSTPPTLKAEQPEELENEQVALNEEGMPTEEVLTDQEVTAEDTAIDADNTAESVGEAGDGSVTEDTSTESSDAGSESDSSGGSDGGSSDGGGGDGGGGGGDGGGGD